MKPIKYSEYRPPLARLAAKEWGGDCTSYKTTRKGIGNYSCAAHGGYLVDHRAVSKAEKERLEKEATVSRIQLAVQHRQDGDYVIGESTVYFGSTYRRPKSIRYDPSLGNVEWVDYPIYEGEEDEMWCVIEKITGVRSAGTLNPEEHERDIDECYERVGRRRRE